MSSWKRDFGSGIVLLGPILISIFVLYYIYGLVESHTPGIILNANLLEPVLPNTSEHVREQVAGFLRVILFLTSFSLVVISVGYLMRTTAGDLIENVIDDFINRIPGLRLVYNASKTATETAFGEGESLQEPVKVETWDGLRMTAFKTGKQTDDGRELVFIPTSPNITTGFVVEVAPSDITELNETVEEALTRVVSAGFGDANHSSETDGVTIEVISEVRDSKRSNKNQ